MTEPTPTPPQIGRHPPRCITVPEFARYFRLGRDKVLGFIRRGDLPALNVASETSTRPRYILRPEDVEVWVCRRSVQAQVPTPRRRRRTWATGREWF